MADKVHKELYWFEAVVVRNRNGVAVERNQQGSVQATCALDALDVLALRAKTIWRGFIKSAKVYEVDQEGEIVASTSSERYDPVDETSHDVTLRDAEVWRYATVLGKVSFKTYNG